MSLVVDRRTVHFQRDDDALAAIDGRRDAWLTQQLDLARLFCRIDRKGAFIAAGCGSVAQLASRRGYDGRRARELCRLGYALDAQPELERLLRDNLIGFQAACALGRIHEDPTLLAEGDDWVRWARFERLSDLQRRIGQRVESVRQARSADVTFTAHVTLRTAENLARCRQIASQKAGLLLTNGQLLEVFSTGYLLEHDVNEQRDRPQDTCGSDANGSAAAPQAVASRRDGRAAGPSWGVGSRARRLGPTSERPHDRTVPAEVLHALEERSGGLCEFGACERPAVETCHFRPHAEGSGREVTDLVRGCHLHHKAHDAGLVRFLGWTRHDDPTGGDLPVFLAVETGEILRPKPRPRPGAGTKPLAERPAWLLRALGSRLRKRLEPAPSRTGPKSAGRREQTPPGRGRKTARGRTPGPREAGPAEPGDGDPASAGTPPESSPAERPAPAEGRSPAGEAGETRSARDPPSARGP